MDIEESKKAAEESINSLLQICHKAGKLAFGMDVGYRKLNKGKCKLLILSSDLSVRNSKKLEKEGHDKGVTVIEYGTKAEFGRIFNRTETGILSIEDRNFARGIKKKLEEIKLLEANWEV